LLRHLCSIFSTIQNSTSFPECNMNVQEIRVMARQLGIRPGKLPKLELVRQIQQTEGNFACFATAIDGRCDQPGCLWRKDCFAMAAKAQ